MGAAASCSGGRDVMGAGQSSAHTAYKSKVIAPISGDNGTIRRALILKDGEPLPSTYLPTVTTAYEAFNRARTEYAARPCFVSAPFCVCICDLHEVRFKVTSMRSRSTTCRATAS